MSREVIQDFLNLAGVVGIALTNRRMRPYFYGLDAVLDRTKQALGQGVLQVVENVPDGFESFEFHFAGHVVFIYKLTHGLVLLVLTDSSLKLVDYRRGITKVKHLIETDTYNTVSYFKLLLGSVTQHSLPSTNWQSNSQPNNQQSSGTATFQTTVQDQKTKQSFTNPASNSTITVPSSKTDNSQQTTTQTNKKQENTIPTANVANQNTQTQASIAKPNTASTVTTGVTTRTTTTTTPRAEIITKVADSNNSATSTNPTNSPAKSVSGKTALEEYKLDELLAALNKLSSFTTQYLGKVVVTNYWKSSRPDSAWLTEFEIDRSGQISHPQQKVIACTPAQHQQIQSWVTAYIKRCKQVIRNFDQMLEQDCLDTRQRQMLL
jgi:hypothetical protein